jgi:transposase
VTVGGVVGLTGAQMSYLLEAIDWRNPQHNQSWSSTSIFIPAPRGRLEL